MSSSEIVYRISPDVYHSRKESSLRIIHIDRNDLITLTGPAAEIFLAFDGTKHVGLIRKETTERFPGSNSSGDFDNLLKFLKGQGLIEEV